MRQITRLLVLSIMMGVLALSVSAHDKKKQGKAQGHDHTAQTAKTKGEFLGKGDGLETCPVTGEPITDKDVKATFFGRTVYFCCPGCLNMAKKNPAAYIKRTHEEQLAAIKNLPKEEGHDHGDHHPAAKQEDAPKGEQKFLGKGDGIETCPVTGEPVNKKISAEILGRTVYVCCEMCLETIKKSPELYLKKQDDK
jgi:YHS domain-containing protein